MIHMQNLFTVHTVALHIKLNLEMVDLDAALVA